MAFVEVNPSTVLWDIVDVSQWDLILRRWIRAAQAFSDHSRCFDISHDHVFASLIVGALGETGFKFLTTAVPTTDNGPSY